MQKHLQFNINNFNASQKNGENVYTYIHHSIYIYNYFHEKVIRKKCN